MKTAANHTANTHKRYTLLAQSSWNFDKGAVAHHRCKKSAAWRGTFLTDGSAPSTSPVTGAGLTRKLANLYASVAAVHTPDEAGNPDGVEVVLGMTSNRVDR